MGDGIVGGTDEPSPAQHTKLRYSEFFDEIFPYYLAIGMPSEEFWSGDCDLVKFYREAERFRTDKANQMLWLQGRYIYDALCAVSPVMHAYAKKGTKPVPYMKEPYPLGASAAARTEVKEKEEADGNARAKQLMEVFMIRHNRQFAQQQAARKQGGGDGKFP